MRSEHADFHRGQRLDAASSIRAGYPFVFLDLYPFVELFLASRRATICAIPERLKTTLAIMKPQRLGVSTKNIPNQPSNASISCFAATVGGISPLTTSCSMRARVAFTPIC
uniref:Uncharacterized protein n=1 Tax=Candidatus Kentrum sp. TC TaxID=2126339 RepID=A0A450YAA9_9GAMM|nr:MAG: hypothetical protein BECKTC1821D_GA0114238_100490 [Candidatus Kentron sp. TC]